MNCHAFRSGFSAYVESRDGSPEAWSRLEQHAAVCSESGCQQLWADQRLLAAVIPGWKESIPPVLLSKRVLLELREARSMEPRPQPVLRSDEEALIPTGSWTSVAAPPTRRWLGFAAAVASLLLFVSLIPMGYPPAVGIATQELLPPENLSLPQTRRATQIELRSDIPDVVRTYVRVPQTATEFVTDTVVMFLPGGSSDPNDEPLSRPALWRGRLSEQLEPWGRELGTAFDAILESVTAPPTSSQRESTRRFDRSETA